MYIYILAKFYKHMIINEGEPGLKRKSEGKKTQKRAYFAKNEFYHANEGWKLQLRPKSHFVMKCTKKIRDNSFVENGHLCKSDLSPCSAPVCTYEKVHKIRKIPFTLIYQVPKSQVNILITKKMVPIFQTAKNSPFLCRFWFFPSTGEGGPPRPQVL